MLFASEETEGVLEALKVDAEALSPNRIKDMIDTMLPGLIGFAINCLLAFIIFIVGRKIIKLLLKILEQSFKKASVEVSIRKFLHQVTQAILYGFLIFILIERIGVPTASFVTILGSAGLAVGLALQGSLSNFAGGVLILLLKPFKVGDYIIEDNRKNEGVVKVIGLFYTTLTTADNRLVVLPNGSLANNSMTNASACDKRRLDITVGISYDSDLKAAKDIIFQLLKKQEAILQEEEMIVFVSALDSHAVILGCRAWVPSGQLLSVKWAMTEAIKLEFEENGIQIPFPQMEIHMKSES